ncbi:MAG TPA: efflux RND transporter periplasmic adaptor subunit, partial [Psychrobacter sp.]|nr:efflux RND transporter periplasmic adaptor subunit [Psychrobacter sp.]
PWLIPALIAVLVIGFVLGKYWGGSADELREESVASSGVAGGNEADSTASMEQSVLSVETVSPSQDDIGRTLSADGTINAKDIASV